MNKNQNILDKWYNAVPDEEKKLFAYDGVYFKGDFEEWTPGRFHRLESKNKSEEKDWNAAKLKVLFLTKEQCTDTAENIKNGTAEAWDGRFDIGRNLVDSEKIPSRYYQNLMYIFYGLMNTTADFKPDFYFSYKDAMDLFDKYPVARINVKKTGGTSTVSNEVVVQYMEKYSKYLTEQIENLDAHILICCSYSENVKDTGNIILNYLNEHTKYHFKKISNWIYYDEVNNKVAINSYHISYTSVSPETFYTSIVEEYKNFLKEHPEFSGR